MFSTDSADLSLNVQCRSLSAIRNRCGSDHYKSGALGMSRFLVGSRVTEDPSNGQKNGANHLYVVRYHPEFNELGIDAMLPHTSGPVNSLASCPTDPTYVLTASSFAQTRSSDVNSSVHLWRLPRLCVERTDDRSFREAMMMDESADSHLIVRASFDDVSGNSTILQGESERFALQPVVSLSQPSMQKSRSFHATVDIQWRTPTSLLNDHSDMPSINSAGTSGDVVTVDSNSSLIQWDVFPGTAAASPLRTVNIRRQMSNYQQKSTFSFPSLTPPRACWDPHSPNGDLIAVTDGGSFVQLLDWRVDTSAPSGTVSSFQAHRLGVTDLDFNPNKPYVLATSAQDGMIKFWDLRRIHHTRPLLTVRGGHSHWCWRVKYNPSHDQLVLSSGTDAVANLWRVSTISSAPLLVNHHINKANSTSVKSVMQSVRNPSIDDLSNQVENREMNDSDEEVEDDPIGSTQSDSVASNALVTRHEYSSSVYGIAWSLVDEWTYMCTSYDGKVTLHHVPSKEKYKILL
jgi:EARP and GARP complex-interacting protein 1